MTCKPLVRARNAGGFLLAVFIFICGIAATTAGERVIVVFDASGSMWGQISGTAKIAIARKVLKRSIADWQELDLEAGLIVYGHRRKGDCTDIETMIPAGPIDAQRFARVIDRVRPRGKTPLTAAVRKAAEELKYTEEKATVILLSDGLETCNLDPCAIASELERDGVDFTTHVIGFDVAKGEELRQLRCIAENTGGLFLPAGNANELSQAFEQVIAPQPLTFAAIDAARGREVRGPVRWTVRGGDVEIETTSETARLEIPDLPNGSYQVHAVAGPYKGDGQYDVGDDRSKAIAVNLTAELPKATVTAKDTVPASEEFQVTWTGPGAPGDKIQLARPGSVPGSSFVHSVDAGQGSPVTLRAPMEQGTYQLRYYSGEHDKLLARRRIDVGEPLPTAFLKALDEVPAGATFEVEWTGPGHEADWIDIAAPGTPAGQYVSYVYVKAGNPVQMRAPATPGTYELRYINGSETKVMGTRTLTVTSGGVSLTALDEVPAGGTFEIEWTGPGHPSDWVDIAAPGTPAGKYVSYVYVKAGNPVQMRAPSTPGTYELRYINGSETKIMGTRTLTVVSGGVSLKALDEVPAGSKFEVAWTGPGHQADWVDIAAPGTPAGQYVSYVYVKAGNPVQMRAPSAPGTYELRYINGSETKIMGARTLTVVSAGVSLKALDEVPAGAPFEVEWAGPGHQADWVDIAAPGTPAGKYVSYVYVKAGNPVQMRAPATPGTYELRYINGSETKIMGTRTLTVVSGGVSLKALDEVPAGASFEIEWAGPGHQADWVDIAAPGTPAGQYVSYVYVKSGNPVQMRAPATPGTYEIRYINGSETKVMGTRTLAVVRPNASE